MKDRSLSWPSLKAAGVRTKNKAQEISGLAKPSAFLLSWAAGRYFQVRTYGCQANVRDSEVITAYLQNLGMKPTTDPVVANAVETSSKAKAITIWRGVAVVSAV